MRQSLLSSCQRPLAYRQAWASRQWSICHDPCSLLQGHFSPSQQVTQDSWEGEQGPGQETQPQF